MQRAKSMLRFAAIILIVSAVSIRAFSQSSGEGPSFQETVQWIQQFLADQGYANKQFHFSDYGIDEDNNELMEYSDMQRIEIWQDTSKIDVYFLQFTGPAYDCNAIDHEIPATEVKTRCARRDVATMWLRFRNENEASKENMQRLLNAFKHLAELSGAKVNQKEPF